MRYEVVTTGKGMLPAGVIVGDVEADSLEAATKAIIKQVGEKRMIWKLKKEFD